MCSIVGACVDITKLDADKRREFHEFLSCLFTMGELRGTDAAGFWAWRNDHYVAEKRPIPAQDLIDRSMKWKSLRFSPASLYLCHTRFATQGDPNDNINNHPHNGAHAVMIHNGCVFDHKKLMSENKVEIESECDSEVLLRLVEQKEEIKKGISHLFSRIDLSATSASMACALIDKRSPNQIYLFRNSGNPCYLYFSKRFNAFFFVSTDTIFEQALLMMYDDKKLATIEAVGGLIDTEKLYILEPGKTLVQEKIEFEKRTYTGNTSFWGNADDDYAGYTGGIKRSTSPKEDVIAICSDSLVMGEKFKLTFAGNLVSNVVAKKHTDVSLSDVKDMSEEETKVFNEFLESFDG